MPTDFADIIRGRLRAIPDYPKPGIQYSET